MEAGKKVRKYKVGDRVMSCKNNGTFADYFIAQEENLHLIPAEMDMDLGCLGEPLACIMYSIFNSGVQLGDTVAVMGLGFAGQIMVQGAKRKGALTVVGIDPLAGKRVLAKNLGADYVFDPKDPDAEQAIRNITGGRGVDVVFEAAGSGKRLPGPDGRVNLSGTQGGNPFNEQGGAAAENALPFIKVNSSTY